MITGIPSGLDLAGFDAFGIYTRLTATGFQDETDQCTRTATSPRALEVKATSPSIPAVMRPALRCVTCRTLTSVLDRLRSISFCRFLTLGQSCSCAALKIRCRIRRTSSSRVRQSMASHAGSTSSGPFTVTASTLVSVSMASNLPFGSGGSNRIASKAHLPTSAPFRVRAAARYPAGYAGRSTEGPTTLSRFPVALRRTGVRFLSILFPPEDWAFVTSGLPAAPDGAPDPDGVLTFRMRELRPGWAPPRPRGQRCSHDRRRFSGRRLPFLHGQALHPGLHPISRGSG